MRKLESCLSIENGTSFKRAEDGKTFELVSAIDIECLIYSVDSCLFEGEQQKRCDWLFAIPKDRERNIDLNIQQQRAFYVELKGEDHWRACEQLYNSIDKTKTAFPNYEFHARIISPKGYQPELINNEFYKKVKRLIRRDIIVGKVHKGNQYKHTESI